MFNFLRCSFLFILIYEKEYLCIKLNLGLLKVLHKTFQRGVSYYFSLRFKENTIPLVGRAKWVSSGLTLCVQPSTSPTSKSDDTTQGTHFYRQRNRYQYTQLSIRKRPKYVKVVMTTHPMTRTPYHMGTFIKRPYVPVFSSISQYSLSDLTQVYQRFH